MLSHTGRAAEGDQQQPANMNRKDKKRAREDRKISMATKLKLRAEARSMVTGLFRSVDGIGISRCVVGSGWSNPTPRQRLWVAALSIFVVDYTIAALGSMAVRIPY